MNHIAIEFRDIQKTYGKSRVLDKLNLKIPRGKLVTLIGPSGCGKTTCLKMINRLIEPTAGKIIINNEEIDQMDPVELRRNIGYVIQQIGLFPHMTIEENISLVPKLKKIPEKSFTNRVEELLDLVGMDPAQFRTRYPRELSGGQQQRIGVARALAADPSIVLMDEPFSALDPISREQLQDEIVQLQNTLHKTILFVTHDMDEALKISDEIILMNKGKVVQQDVPHQILQNPKNEFVREFVGEKRFAQSSSFSKAKDIMTEGITVPSSYKVQECIRLLQQNGVSELVVTDSNQKYLGLISPKEIFAHLDNQTLTASHLMAKEKEAVGPETLVADIIPLFQETERDSIAVIDEKEQLMGVITKTMLFQLITTTVAGGSDMEHAS